MSKCDFYPEVRERAKHLAENTDSHSCNNCLYNHLCIPDKMQICTDYRDGRRYSEHTFLPNDEAYCIFAGVVYPAHITRSACVITEDGERHEHIMYYILVGDVKVEFRWMVGYSLDRRKELYHSYADAEKALKEAKNNAKED